MMELVEMQKHISRLISEGFLKDFDAVMTYLRLSWRRKYEPKLLSNALTYILKENFTNLLLYSYIHFRIINLVEIY
ncbi:MAG: hypothetical protein RSE50_00640, partial [Myroides sp.]